jgi:hypothetical protein
VSAFAVGDRVHIAAEWHPWHGSTGIIDRPAGDLRAGFDWIIRLDREDAFGGHECAASESDLLPAPKHASDPARPAPSA